VLFQLLDGLAKLAALIFGGGFVRLRLGIVRARQGIGEVDREHAVAWNPVGFHPPQGRDPQRRMVAIAVYEENRRNFRGGRGARRRLRQRSHVKISGGQGGGKGQRSCAFQNRPPR
jgi:hypothetical protein